MSWVYSSVTGAYYNKCQHGRAAFFCSQCFPVDGVSVALCDAFDCEMHKQLSPAKADEPGWDANGSPC